MPDLSVRIPPYRLHKPSGCAVVTLGDTNRYLGRHGSDESKAEYQRVIAEWITRGRVAPAAKGGGGPSVNEVMLAYVTFGESYYRDADGKPSRELETMKLAFRPLKALYGHTAAADFGPLALKTVRQRLIDSGLARPVINQRLGYVKRMFRWAGSEQLIPPAVYHGLLCVQGLQRGRSPAKETEPVRPVPDAHVDAIVPFLPPTVRAMLGLQRLTGMRSGELVRMRACDLDTTGPVWVYRPPRHKTSYLGRKRIIAPGRPVPRLHPPLSETGPGGVTLQPEAGAGRAGGDPASRQKVPRAAFAAEPAEG